jgi:hypothetical protein
LFGGEVVGVLRIRRNEIAGLCVAAAALVAVWDGAGVLLGGDLGRSAGVGASRPVAAAVVGDSEVDRLGGVGKGGIALHLTGVNSCAAASCHGGGRVVEDLSFAAAQIWQRRDPHARAWQVLSQPLAVEMMRRLAAPGEEPIPAFEDTRCLNCHVTTERPLEGARVSVELMHRDGVGCESCHGAAGGWLAAHTTAEWKLYTSEQKQGLGFVDTTSDLHRRAAMCAECHVGGEGRDVNHDLIAAGHPRMDFEFRMFHANEPKHWTAGGVGGRNRGSNVEVRATFELDAWLAGQLAVGRAAAGLLQERTRDGRPWPELAEYSCFSCHHDLRRESWYGSLGGSSGRLQWGTWTFGAYPGISVLAGAEAELGEVRRLMERPHPDRAAVRLAAERLAGRLGQVGDRVQSPVDAESLNRLAVELIDGSAAAVQSRVRPGYGGQVPAAGTWDEAAQLYLGLHAVLAARSRSGVELSAEERRLLEEMRQGLLYEERVDSPGNRGTAEAAGEMSLRVKRVREELLGRGGR